MSKHVEQAFIAITTGTTLSIRAINSKLDDASFLPEASHLKYKNFWLPLV